MKYRLIISILVALITPCLLYADSVRLLEEPADGWQARVDLIQQASSTIDMEYYSFANDEIAKTFFGLLLDAADRGVKIRIITDFLTNGLTPGTAAHLTDHENIELKLFQPIRKIYAPLHWNRHLHDKALVIDQREMITGGRNISNRFYGFSDGDATLDRDIYIKGEDDSTNVPIEYLKYFNAMWDDYQTGTTSVEIQRNHECAPFILGFPCRQMQRNLERQREAAEEAITSWYATIQEERPGMFNRSYDWSQEEAVSGVPISFVHDPIGEKSEDSGTALSLREAFNNAESFVYLQSPYVVPTRTWMQTFEGLHDRAVPFRVLTNSIYSSPNLLGITATNHYKPYYLGETIEASWWEYYGVGANIHHKSTVIDNKLAIVGSFNLDPRSTFSNTELLFFIDSPEFAAILTEAMDGHRSLSVELDSEGDPIITESSPQIHELSFLYRMFVEILSFLAPIYRIVT